MWAAYCLFWRGQWRVLLYIQPSLLIDTFGDSDGLSCTLIKRYLQIVLQWCAHGPAMGADFCEITWIGRKIRVPDLIVEFNFVIVPESILFFIYAFDYQNQSAAHD